MEWDVLGAGDEGAIATLRGDPGTLSDKKWLSISWKMPPKETAPCWWLVNPHGEETKPPSFLCRSLACIRLELKSNRVASATSLRQTYERRSEDNAKAAVVLRQNGGTWKHVGGPDPETLFAPSENALERCRHACERLDQLRSADDPDGLDEYTAEMKQAVASLKSLAWETIRIERFHMTPPALYSEFVRNAESLLHKRADELIRRREWLAAPVEEMNDPDVPVKAGRVDKYGLDLDEFKLNIGRKPRTWKEAVKIAGWIHIDEIRSLLELHYDDVHYAKWKREDGKASSRKSEYTVLNKVARAYRSKLCQRLALPKSVKQNFEAAGRPGFLGKA